MRRSCILRGVTCFLIGLQQVALAESYELPYSQDTGQSAGQIRAQGGEVQANRCGHDACGPECGIGATSQGFLGDKLRVIGDGLNVFPSGWSAASSLGNYNVFSSGWNAAADAFSSGLNAASRVSDSVGDRVSDYNVVSSGLNAASDAVSSGLTAAARVSDYDVVSSGWNAASRVSDYNVLSSGWNAASSVGGSFVSGIKSCCPIDPCRPCPPPFWEHRSHLFGDFLYLSPGGVDLGYATHVDGTSATAIPLASPDIVDPNYEPGFRIGGALSLDEKTSLKATYWYYESGTLDSHGLPGGTGFLRPDLVHPNTLTVASDRLSAVANHGIDFQMIDLDYESALSCNDHWVLNYLLGVRYANLDQDFNASYANLDTFNVNSEIDFDGVGPRVGLDGKREIGDKGLMLFSRATANFIVGEFTSNYRQRNLTTSVTEAVTGFTDDRIVTMLELELGVGWRNCCDSFRLYAGYYVAAWFNSVTTPSFIDGVQRNDFHDLDDLLTFDGLTVRTEFRF